MLKSKTFVKKTRSGGVMKIVREHYLRDDIWCGSEFCVECKHDSTVLQKEAVIESDLCSSPHYIIPDTNVVLHQIDILEDPLIKNVIVLQTVLQEIRHRSAPVYKRIKDVIHTAAKHFYTFTNEHHRETFIEREQGESANDRNDRAIRTAAQWYSEHLKKAPDAQDLKIILLTNDKANKQKAEECGLSAYKCEEYIKSLIANPELVDRLALSSDDINEITTGKVLFPEHLPLSRIQAGIKSGSLLQGTFRASRDNYLEATVFIQGDGEDSTEVLIQGLQNLNRAVHQDVVAMELLPREAWASPSSLVLLDEGPKADSENLEEENVLNCAASNALLKPTGKVVGIIKRNWRPFCGMLSQSHIKEATRHLFTPADRRIPRIRVETRQAATLAGQRIMVAIDGWPKHSRYPNGHFVKALGNAGDKETETEVLLLEHDVPHQAFSQLVLSFLPKMPWAITEEVIRPLCCNAMVRTLSGSFHRLAFSCIWEVNQDAEILHTRFTKSVINSKASLTYAEAQMRIDDSNMNDDITKSLRGLNRLAKILKKKRIEKGALTLSSPEVRFHMDSETHDPVDLQTKELKETNSMVEEFMLLANISVAQKIYDEFSECALLRKHPAPPLSNYDILNKAAKSRDVVVQMDSAKALADSLDRAQIKDFPYFNTLLRILATRCMMQAVYFCSGMDSDFHHYGLASPIYTHFTSPIRRYADIIVHRLLAVAIGADCTDPDLLDKHKRSALCNNLNYRHKMAQYAQRASVALHTQLFFKSRGVLNEEGFILFVRKNAIIVLIPKFGLEGTVFFESKDKITPPLTFNEEGPTLTVQNHTFHLFDRVKVTISLDSSNIQHQKIRMSIIEPVIPGVSVDPPEMEPQTKKARLNP
nr:exosome complex exonuclease RRP44 [Paramormyrops kingsleyae]